MDIARDVKTARFLPAYFSAISHLLALLSQKEPSIPEIVRAVGTEQTLTSRLLTIVNSPVYGTIRQIGSIDEAVVRIGLVGLRNLTLAVSMNDITGGTKRDEWKHSLLVAFIADLMSKKMKSSPQINQGTFVCGLMHDIGKLFLSRRYPLEYQSVFTKMKKGLTVIEAEINTFGYDHAAVGGMLLCAWNIPQYIIDAIRFHHDPNKNELAARIYWSSQVVSWKEQRVEKNTEINIAGFSPMELDWIYMDAVDKAREMEMRIH
jgi:HD-like signal output (HDOD) protein